MADRDVAAEAPARFILTGQSKDRLRGDHHAPRVSQIRSKAREQLQQWLEASLGQGELHWLSQSCLRVLHGFLDGLAFFVLAGVCSLGSQAYVWKSTSLSYSGGSGHWPSPADRDPHAARAWGQDSRRPHSTLHDELVHDDRCKGWVLAIVAGSRQGICTECQTSEVDIKPATT